MAKHYAVSVVVTEDGLSSGYTWSVTEEFYEMFVELNKDLPHTKISGSKDLIEVIKTNLDNGIIQTEESK